jgi:hypothetical protein
MKKNGDAELSEVPALLAEWRARRNCRAALQARAALTDACEDLLIAADRESRGLTAGESRQFDDHARAAREISEALQTHKRETIQDLVARGIDASECRLNV